MNTRQKYPYDKRSPSIHADGAFQTAAAATVLDKGVTKIKVYKIRGIGGLHIYRFNSEPAPENADHVKTYTRGADGHWPRR